MVAYQFIYTTCLSTSTSTVLGPGNGYPKTGIRKMDGRNPCVSEPYKLKTHDPRFRVPLACYEYKHPNLRLRILCGRTDAHRQLAIPLFSSCVWALGACTLVTSDARHLVEAMGRGIALQHSKEL